MNPIDISDLALDDLDVLSGSPVAGELAQLAEQIDEEHREVRGWLGFNSALM
jgi:hypothetical protein